MKRICLFWAGICLVAAVATACGESTSTQEATTTTAAATTTQTPEATSARAAASAATISIANMSFGEPVTVAAGAQVTVINKDSVEHSVTSDTADQFDVEIEGNEQGTFAAPSQPGEYAFHCTYHPSMKGTLIVQ